MTMLYYQDQDGVTQGPVTAEGMLDLWRRGVVRDQTLTALEGDEDWLPLTMFRDLVQPPKVVTRVEAVGLVRERKKAMSLGAKIGVGLTVVGLVVFALANVLVGGIAAGLGLLMVIAFK